jgi:hypothetical protein
VRDWWGDKEKKEAQRRWISGGHRRWTKVVVGGEVGHL